MEYKIILLLLIVSLILPSLNTHSSTFTISFSLSLFFFSFLFCKWVFSTYLSEQLIIIIIIYINKKISWLHILNYSYILFFFGQANVDFINERMNRGLVKKPCWPNRKKENPYLQLERKHGNPILSRNMSLWTSLGRSSFLQKSIFDCVQWAIFTEISATLFASR